MAPRRSTSGTTVRANPTAHILTPPHTTSNRCAAARGCVPSAGVASPGRENPLGALTNAGPRQGWGRRSGRPRLLAGSPAPDKEQWDVLNRGCHGSRPGSGRPGLSVAGAADAGPVLCRAHSAGLFRDRLSRNDPFRRVALSPYRRRALPDLGAPVDEGDG